MGEKPEYLEMAKALYHFKATIAKTLSFRESDYFIIYQPSTKQKNWWQVINSKSQIGYVPSNYVISVHVSHEFVIKFVDDCLTLLRKESDKAGGCLPNDRQEILLKLLERKTQVEKSLHRKSLTSLDEDYCATSTCTSASRISPPLLLNSQNKVKHIQSFPSLQSDSKDESPRLSDSLERRSVSSLGQTSGLSYLERTISKEAVSDICGQVGSPLSEARKTSVSARQDSELSKSNPPSRKPSTPKNEIVTEETVYHLIEQV